MDVFLAAGGTFLGMVLGRTRCLLHNCLQKDQTCSLAYNDPKVQLTGAKSEGEQFTSEGSARSDESVVTLAPAEWPPEPGTPRRTPSTTSSAKTRR